MAQHQIFTNCNIYSMDSLNSLQHAMVTLDDKIVFVGDENGARSAYPDGRVIDLDGKTVFPGFCDSHAARVCDRSNPQ